jgi:hypothetical protein
MNKRKTDSFLVVDDSGAEHTLCVYTNFTEFNGSSIAGSHNLQLEDGTEINDVDAEKGLYEDLDGNQYRRI